MCHPPLEKITIIKNVTVVINKTMNSFFIDIQLPSKKIKKVATFYKLPRQFMGDTNLKDQYATLKYKSADKSKEKKIDEINMYKTILSISEPENTRFTYPNPNSKILILTKSRDTLEVNKECKTGVSLTKETINVKQWKKTNNVI